MCVCISAPYSFAERVGTVHLDKGTGTANTAVAFHAGRLLALHDDDLPYAVGGGGG